MNILLLGGVAVTQLQSVLEKRFMGTVFTSIVASDTSDSELATIALAHNHIDRAVLFEQFITRDGRTTDIGAIREKTESIVKLLSKDADCGELVCVGTSHEIASLMREELFEIRHKAVTAEFNGSSIKMNKIAELVAMSVMQLNEQYKADDNNDESTYESDTDVLWSDEVGIVKDEVDEWDDSDKEIVIIDTDDDAGGSTAGESKQEHTKDTKKKSWFRR